MGCNCGKPKCDGQCGCKSPAVLQINNPPEYITFHKVSVPAAMGDSTTNPPAVGKYKNVLLYYEADQTSWLYSTDGIPTRLTNGITNYEDAINLPEINGNTLIGDKASEELGLQDKLTAGENIQISDENIISATDTTYTAGDGIEINSDNEISAKIGRGLELSADGEIDVSEDYIIGFDNVADMKSSTNLINGSYARTLGYYTKNDGGGATYKIRNVTNDDVIDEGSIIEMNDDQNELVAELIVEGAISSKIFGAYGDGTHDDTAKLQLLLNYSKDKYFDEGTYLISDTLDFDGSNNIKFAKNAKIITNTVIDCMFEFNNSANAPISQNVTIENMHLDGNDKAKCGMITSNYVNLYFNNLQIDNVTEKGMLTKGSNSRQQAELRITKSCIRNYNYAYANSIGIDMNSTDGSYSDMSVVDFETAFNIRANGNSIVNTHPWIHFVELWEKSVAYNIDNSDFVVIDGGFVDSIRTAYVNTTGGLINVSNMIIYHALTLYGDDTDSGSSYSASVYMENKPAMIFKGTNSTRIRATNIYCYALAGDDHVICNFYNSDNALNDCVFLPENKWTQQIFDFGRARNGQITPVAEKLTITHSDTLKTGRIVNLQLKGTILTNMVGYETIATLPFKPAQETFIIDGTGKQYYISVNGELQTRENITANTAIRLATSYIGNLI